jgi:DNA-directed RNA polymerase specialized sigma24 family protein
VFSLAFYMTGSEVEAESILTETFVRAFQSDPEPDGALVDRSLLGRLREQYPLDERHAGPMPAISNVAVTRNVLRTELEESIQELPATERMIFLLRDVECYSTAAIAGLLHMPESSVQRVLMMARLRLRQQLAAGVMGTSPIPHLEAA